MLVLYLLVAHLVGDFVLQTRWQADGKFGWAGDAVALRAQHVATYGIPYVPIVAWRLAAGEGFWNVATFFWALLVLHFLTDSRRFTSTVGDVASWFLTSPAERRERRWQWEAAAPADVPYNWEDWPPPNPWPLLPLVIDQTLHLAQLAALGWLLT